MVHFLLINDCSFPCRMKEASKILKATNEGLHITSSCNHHSVIKIKVHFKNARVVKLTLKKNI